MKQLPNGLTIFNATPHILRFWQEGWPEPVEAPRDELVNARIEETEVPRPAEIPGLSLTGVVPEPMSKVSFVTPRFVGTDEGRAIAERAYANGADLVVGSIIAAQAYPGLVVAMVATPGFERVPPAQRRARPDRFMVYMG